MKKQLLLLLVFLQGINSVAQNRPPHRDFIEEGKVWTVGKFEKHKTEPVEIREYYFGGDTIINNTECKKMMCRKTVNGQVQSETLVESLFERGCKVGFFRGTKRFWLFDFSFEKKGSVLLCRAGDDYNPAIVGLNDAMTSCVNEDTEECTIHGRPCWIFLYQDDWQDYSYRLNYSIDGIGSVYAPDIGLHTNHPDFSYRLLECRVNDEVIYTQEDDPVAFVDSVANAEAGLDTLKYVPFVEKGKTWLVTYSDNHGSTPVYGTDTYYFDGDTIVHGQTCQKLMCRAERYEEKSVSTGLVFPMYEQEHKVYFFRPDTDKPILMYDFDVCRGDTVRMSHQIQGATADVRSYLVWDPCIFRGYGPRFYRKRPIGWFYVPLKGFLASAMVEREVTEGPEYVCLEGIGSFYNPFEKTDLCYGSEPVALLRECRVGDRLIYTNNVDGTLGIHSFETTPGQPATSYDLQGRPVDGTQRGILIRNGKKMLVK